MKVKLYKRLQESNPSIYNPDLLDDQDDDELDNIEALTSIVKNSYAKEIEPVICYLTYTNEELNGRHIAHLQFTGNIKPEKIKEQNIFIKKHTNRNNNHKNVPYISETDL